jgi:hypothetical protein
MAEGRPRPFRHGILGLIAMQSRSRHNRARPWRAAGGARIARAAGSATHSSYLFKRKGESAARFSNARRHIDAGWPT